MLQSPPFLSSFFYDYLEEVTFIVLSILELFGLAALLIV